MGWELMTGDAISTDAGPGPAHAFKMEGGRVEGKDLTDPSIMCWM